MAWSVSESLPFARRDDAFHTVNAVLLLSAGYLMAMTLATLFMNGRVRVISSLFSLAHSLLQKPFSLKYFSFVHNSFLCLYSLYAFLGLLRSLNKNFWGSSSSTMALLFCDAKHEMMAGDMNFWVYHFYLSKVVEWVDTLILILRGKQLVPPANRQFALHLFHHTTAISIVWSTWRHPISTSWLGPITNATVHVIM